MPHPLLQRADIDAVLQVPGRIGVTELVKKPTGTEWTIGAAIDFHARVLKLVRDGAMAAIEFSAVRDGL